MKARVVLTAYEAVVPRGTERVTWLVHVSGAWCSAKDVPGALLTQQDAGPGLIWETSAELSLDAGSWVMQIRRRPREGGFGDPLRYLEAEVRRARERVTRRYFIVGRRGELSTPARGVEPPADTDPPDPD